MLWSRPRSKEILCPVLTETDSNLPADFLVRLRPQAASGLCHVMWWPWNWSDETQVFCWFLNNFPFPQFIIPVAANNQKLCSSFMSKLLDVVVKMMVLWNQDHTQLLHCVPMDTGSSGLALATPWKIRLCSHHLLSNWNYVGYARNFP